MLSFNWPREIAPKRLSPTQPLAKRLIAYHRNATQPFDDFSIGRAWHHAPTEPRLCCLPLLHSDSQCFVSLRRPLSFASRKVVASASPAVTRVVPPSLSRLWVLEESHRTRRENPRKVSIRCILAQAKWLHERHMLVRRPGWR